jgi:hypothetical protein
MSFLIIAQDNLCDLGLRKGTSEEWAFCRCAWLALDGNPASLERGDRRSRRSRLKPSANLRSIGADQSAGCSTFRMHSVPAQGKDIP